VGGSTTQPPNHPTTLFQYSLRVFQTYLKGYYQAIKVARVFKSVFIILNTQYRIVSLSYNNHSNCHEKV